MTLPNLSLFPSYQSLMEVTHVRSLDGETHVLYVRQTEVRLDTRTVRSLDGGEVRHTYCTFVRRRLLVSEWE